MQGVEGVEELLLGALLLGEELNIIDQKDVDGEELVAEAGHLVIAQRVDHLVGELLAGDVADGRLRLALLDLMPDGLHEVGLAHADAAIEEERVIGLRWPLRDGLARCVRKLISAADDESVEGVARIQLRSAIPVESRLRGMAGGREARGEAAIVAKRRGSR